MKDDMALGTIDGRELSAYQIITGANSLGYHWLIRYWFKTDNETHYINEHSQTDGRDNGITSIDMAYGLAENAWKKLVDGKAVSDGTNIP